MPRATPGWRARVFGLTWLSYFSFYQSRKNFSVVKKSLESEGVATRDELAVIDTTYLASYAVGQFVWGTLADRVSARRMLAVGMLGSAAMGVLFGLSDTAAAVALFFGINGLFQSIGWPANGRITASWFSTRERGEVMGWWGTCYQVGPVVAKLAAGWLLVRYGWRWAMFGPAAWTATAGIAIYLLVRDRPEDVGFEATDEPLPDDAEARRELRRAAFWGLLTAPRLWLLGSAYACIKLMRYSLWFWLPYYFSTSLGYADDTAAYMSTSFDIGGVVGVVGSGILADRVLGRRRIGTAVAMMVLLAGALGLYSLVGASSPLANFLSMMLVGALLFGPDALVSGAAAQDAGGAHAAAAGCGFVNGIGSIGGAMEGLVTVAVAETLGWGALFYVFMGLALASAALLVPLARWRPGTATSST